MNFKLELDRHSRVLCSGSGFLNTAIGSRVLEYSCSVTVYRVEVNTLGHRLVQSESEYFVSGTYSRISLGANEPKVHTLRRALMQAIF